MTDPENSGLSDGQDDDESPERPIERIHRTARRGVIAAGLLGLRDALEGRPERDRPAVTSVAPGGRAPENFELILDPQHPERSIVILKRPETDAPPVT